MVAVSVKEINEEGFCIKPLYSCTYSVGYIRQIHLSVSETCAHKVKLRTTYLEPIRVCEANILNSPILDKKLIAESHKEKIKRAFFKLLQEVHSQ